MWRAGKRLDMVLTTSRHLLLAALVAVAIASPPAEAQAPTPPAAQQRDAQPQRRDFPLRVHQPSLSGSFLAARIAASSRDFEAAADNFARALARDPRNPELLVSAFVPMLAAGRIDDAADVAARILRTDGRERLARLVVATRAMRERRFRNAITTLRVTERGAADDITGGLIAAWAAQAAGETDEAIGNVERISGADWYTVFKDFHAGLILDIAGRRTEAGRRLAAAHRADGQALRVTEAYARHLARAGERARAAEIVTRFLERAPTNPVMTQLLSDINGNRPVALLARDSQRGAAEVLFGLGAALARDGGDELAAIYLQLAIYLDGENGLSHLALGDLFQQMRRPVQALASLARVPAASPMKRSAEIQAALALDDLERTDEALQHLDALLERDANDMEVLVTRGNILRGKKRFDEANVAYDRAIATLGQVERRHWTLFYFRGITFERTRRWPQAEADFQRALELMPDQPLVLNYLGYSWVDQGVHLDRAMGMLKRAVELRPEDGYIIDSVGWAYYRLGRFEEAVTWLERAIERKPADPVINDHLGDAYWQVGRRLEAYFQWRHARDSKPEPDDLVRIERKIREGLVDPTPTPPAAAVRPAEPAPAGGSGQGG